MTLQSALHIGFSDLNQNEILFIDIFRNWLNGGADHEEAEDQISRALRGNRIHAALDDVFNVFRQVEKVRPDFRGYGFALTVQEECVLDELAARFDDVRASNRIERHGLDLSLYLDGHEH